MVVRILDQVARVDRAAAVLVHLVEMRGAAPVMEATVYSTVLMARLLITQVVAVVLYGAAVRGRGGLEVVALAGLVSLLLGVRALRIQAAVAVVMLMAVAQLLVIVDKV